MKLKKLISLLLASVMVLAMLAGCSNQAGGDTSKAPEGGTPASQPAGEAGVPPSGALLASPPAWLEHPASMARTMTDASSRLMSFFSFIF